MSGGIAYIFDPNSEFEAKCNKASVDLLPLEKAEDIAFMKESLEEFKTERIMGLNLRNVLDKMGVQLNNLGGRYDQFKATKQRRRLMKKEYEEKLNKRTKEIIQRLYKFHY